MSMDFRLVVYGHIGEVETKEVSGAQCTTFSQAAKRSVPKERYDGTPIPCPTGYKESYNGKRWEVTAWIRWTVWRDKAVAAAKYLSKGDLVRCEGVLTGACVDGNQNPRVWTGKDGVPRASYEATLEKFLMAGKPASERTSGDAFSGQEPPPDLFGNGGGADNDSGEMPF